MNIYACVFTADTLLLHHVQESRFSFCHFYFTFKEKEKNALNALNEL